MENSFNILDAYKKYYTRKEAVEGVDINEYLLLARDLNEKDARKLFLRIPIADFESNLPLVLANNKFLYEILPPDIPVKPYFDCEIEADGLTGDDCAELIELFIDFLKAEFLEVFGIKICEFDFALLNSCRENKLSYHIVIQNKIYFKNIAEHKMFVNYLWQRFLNPRNDDETAVFERLTWMYKGVEKRFIFDPLPYSTFQNFRLPNQSKRGKEYILKNETDYSETACLIRLYNGVGDRLKLNVDGLVIETTKTTTKTIATKSTKTTNNSPLYDENGELIFFVEGKSLMEKHHFNYKQILECPTEFLRYLYLIPNTKQTWQFYINIGFAIAGAGGTVKDFISWASLSPLYDANDSAITGFNKFRSSGERTFGIPFLKKYAKIAHPAYFCDTDVLFDNYFSPNYDGVRTITETCPFVSMEGTDFGDDIFSPEKIMVLQAFLGKGKTTAIKRLIQHKKYKRILILSPRIAFAKFMATEFNAALYMDGDLTGDVLVCSMESLHKLYYAVTYDIIIMDECEANLGVFSSTTMKNNQLIIYEILLRLINEAEKVIFASAFITDKTMNFVRSLEIPAVRLYNTALPTRRDAYEVEAQNFDEKLITRIKEGKKIFGVYCSINQMNKTLDKIKEERPYTYKEALIYSGKVDDSIFNTLNNINESWGKASAVFATPTITVGNSYAPDRPADFHQVWIKGYPTCIVADTFQSHMRVRHIKDNTIYFSLPDEKILLMNERGTDFAFRILKDFDDLTENKRKILVDTIDGWLLSASKWDDTDRMELIRDRLTDNYHETPKPLRELLMFNFIEATLSKKFYKQMFIHFLEICNYKTRLLNPEQQKKKTKILEDDGLTKTIVEGGGAAFTDEQKIKMFLNDEFPTKYDDIKTIAHAQFETSIRNIERKRATAIEKEQIEKFYFMHKIPENIPLHEKREYFDIYSDKYKRHIIDNARAERKGGKIVVNKLYELENNSTLEFNNMTAAKLAFIIDLNARLGIEHSLIPVKISREKIEKNTEFICSGRKRIHEMFNLRDKSPDAKPNLKNAVSLIDKVYTAWTGAGLKADGVFGERSTFLKEPYYFRNLIVAREKIPLPLFCI